MALAKRLSYTESMGLSPVPSREVFARVFQILEQSGPGDRDLSIEVHFLVDGTLYQLIRKAKARLDGAGEAIAASEQPPELLLMAVPLKERFKIRLSS